MCPCNILWDWQCLSVVRSLMKVKGSPVVIRLVTGMSMKKKMAVVMGNVKED